MDCKANVKRLLHGIESYNPEHILVLEHHLHWQITNSEYDFEANLALLRLYQFYPEHFNVDATKLVLLKALSSLNPTDFNLCKYLIRLDHLNKEPLSLVVELGLLLEACQFTEFWVNIFSPRDYPWLCVQLRLRENPNITSGVPDFRDAMLKCKSDHSRLVVQIVSQTYQRISKPMLSCFLDVPDVELKQIIKQNGWIECPPTPQTNPDGPWILVNKHEESVRSVKIQERVNFDAITSMAGAFRPSKGEFFIKTGS
ncbi:Eukaryotic translation initiation factor 3 subunit K [Paragonimus westermani]|uniref:Eukaryotic translation initiation factor 3 subunit K n=1 Tax=Paragonimus westermani TaxID=34504 RepID=A0A8T0DJ25_9TREM|nr:Eukaryotic translation initiation factor 3 subunit K [Paragonimus westermani]